MTTIVVDACMMGPLIIPDEIADLDSALMPVLVEGHVIVTANWKLEVLNLARMAVRKKRLSQDQYEEAIDAISGFDVAVDAETNKQAWSVTRNLARRHDLTAYDAAYLELALRVKAPLFTRDGSLRRAATAEGAALL